MISFIHQLCHSRAHQLCHSRAGGNPGNSRWLDSRLRGNDVTKSLIVALLGILSLVSCRGQTTQAPPVVPIRNMHDQPRYDVQAESPFFKDKRTMRPLVEGTLPQEADVDVEVSLGLSNLDEKTYVPTIPQAVIDKAGGMDALLARGHERYNIYCTPCHAISGGGGGIAVQRGMLAAPSFHDDRLRHIPDGQLYNVIANGIRNMPAYGRQILTHDRWAIVGYVRALQISQAGQTAAIQK